MFFLSEKVHFFTFSWIFFAILHGEIYSFYYSLQMKLYCVVYFHVLDLFLSQRRIPPAFLFLYQFISINLSKLLWICFLSAIGDCIQDSSIATKTKKGCFKVPVVRHNRTYQQENMVESESNPPGCVALPIWDYYLHMIAIPGNLQSMRICPWKAAMVTHVIKIKFTDL